MPKLTETVTETVTREVPMHIADLVRFAQAAGAPMSEEDLIAAAWKFYEDQHGED